MPTHEQQIIWLKKAAPLKPEEGQPCNGCGLCCTAVPCPLSRMLLGHKQGPCPALQWHAENHVYRCGLVVSPAHHLPWLPHWSAGLFRRFARRYLAIDQGCDTDVDLEYHD